MKIQSVILAIGVGMLLFGFVTPDQKKGVSVAAKLFSRANADDYMSSDNACGECHSGIKKNFASSPHSASVSSSELPLDKKGCQGCHGPGNIHQAEQNAEVISFAKLSPKESAAACLRCHEQTMAESHWKRSEHARADLSCVSCHKIHTDSPDTLAHAANPDARSAAFVAKVDPKAMLKADEATLCGSCHPMAVGEFRSAHRHPVPEGRVVCSDCHNAHPAKGEKVANDEFKGKCVSCHTEKAGPFVFEHDPVSGVTGEGCQECHRPHGTNNPKLLNSVTRGLCAQCHTDKLTGHFPGRTCWDSGCHVANHGSNTDKRFLKP